MAKIVLGIGTSHGPMMLMEPEDWHVRVAADKGQSHVYRGASYTFEELVKLKRDQDLGEQLRLEVQRKRLRACHRALDCLVEAYNRVRPDVAVIVGNDQMEVFTKENLPCIAVYSGEDVVNIPAGPEQLAKMPPGIPKAARGYWGDEGARWPGQADLGQHIIERMMVEGFDVTQMSTMPQVSDWMSGVPHAFGFVYQKIMRRNVIPNVPILLNTFHPFNQPSTERVYNFGLALKRAIESWEKNLRVAIIASGGLSHFVVDEEFDRSILDAMQNNNREELLGWPESFFQSGTSETKNWLPVAAAMGDVGLRMNLIDYVPCYRSLAGTGNAMAFAVWG